MRLPVLATALTWTPGRRPRHTQPDMAPAWSWCVLRQPGNAPASPSPAPRPACPHRRPLSWRLPPLCPRCFLHAPPAAAHASYMSSAKKGEGKFEQETYKKVRKEAAFCESSEANHWWLWHALGCCWMTWEDVHNDPTSVSSSSSMLLWGAQRGPPSW